MGFFRGVGRVLKPLVNVPKWMGVKQISKDASYIASVAKRLCTPQKATHSETFDEAVKRFNLSEAQVKEQYVSLKRIFLIYAVLSLLILAYTLYLYIGGNWRARLLGTAVFFMMAVQAYRYNFWMFQLRERKLGCTFREWYRHFWIR